MKMACSQSLNDAVCANRLVSGCTFSDLLTLRKVVRYWVLYAVSKSAGWLFPIGTGSALRDAIRTVPTAGEFCYNLDRSVSPRP